MEIIYLQVHIPASSPRTHAQAPNLDLCLPEVDQETSHQSRAPHVVQALGHMSAIERLDGLYLDDHGPIDDKVGFIVAHIDTVIVDLNALLLDHLDFRLPQLVGKRVLGYLFQKSRAQFIGYPEATADDSFGKRILDGHGTLPFPYLPAHLKKVSTGMKGMNGDEIG